MNKQFPVTPSTLFKAGFLVLCGRDQASRAQALLGILSSLSSSYKECWHCRCMARCLSLRMSELRPLGCAASALTAAISQSKFCLIEARKHSNISKIKRFLTPFSIQKFHFIHFIQRKRKTPAVQTSLALLPLALSGRWPVCKSKSPHPRPQSVHRPLCWAWWT